MISSVVTCAPVTSGPGSTPSPYCPSGQGFVVVQAYLLEPSSAFDRVQASGFFFFGMGVVIFGFLLGYVVQQVRKPILSGG